MTRLLGRISAVLAVVITLSASATSANAQQTAAPIFSPASGAYPPGQLITLTDSTPGATIYYVVHGGVPTTSSTKYTGPITVSGVETVTAMAIAPGLAASSNSAAKYDERPYAAAPVFTPGPGTYPYGQTVHISEAISGTNTYFTTDGTTPTTASRQYFVPIELISSQTVSAIAVGSRTQQSIVTTGAYSVTTPAPVLSKSSFISMSPGMIWIKDMLPNAAIYYTTDGSIPTISSTLYTGPITISHTENLNAIAVAPGFAASPVVSGAYVIELISTVAGNGTMGFSGNGGPATDAEFSYADSIAFDPSENLYIADAGNNCVRKVDGSTGIISNFLCSATLGGGVITGGVHMAFDSSGNFYYSDLTNNVVRKIDATSGSSSIYAGNPYGIDISSPFPRGLYSGDGGPATSARLDEPSGLAFDASDNLFIADSGNNVIRKVLRSTGVITTIAGDGYGAKLGFGAGGYGGDGGPATQAKLNFPDSLAFDHGGNLYIADYFNATVRRVDLVSGEITTYAGDYANSNPTSIGDNGPATSAIISSPDGIAFDPNDNLFISELGDYRIRMVTGSTGIITTIAGNGSTNPAIDGVAANASPVPFPRDVAVDGAGNLYILQNYDARVRKVSLSAAPAPVF